MPSLARWRFWKLRSSSPLCLSGNGRERALDVVRVDLLEERPGEELLARVAEQAGDRRAHAREASRRSWTSRTCRARTRGGARGLAGAVGPGRGTTRAGRPPRCTLPRARRSRTVPSYCIVLQPPDARRGRCTGARRAGRRAGRSRRQPSVREITNPNRTASPNLGPVISLMAKKARADATAAAMSTSAAVAATMDQAAGTRSRHPWTTSPSRTAHVVRHRSNRDTAADAVTSPFRGAAEQGFSGRGAG